MILTLSISPEKYVMPLLCSSEIHCSVNQLELHSLAKDDNSSELFDLKHVFALIIIVVIMKISCFLILLVKHRLK